MSSNGNVRKEGRGGVVGPSPVLFCIFFGVIFANLDYFPNFDTFTYR